MDLTPVVKELAFVDGIVLDSGSGDVSVSVSNLKDFSEPVYPVLKGRGHIPLVVHKYGVGPVDLPYGLTDIWINLLYIVYDLTPLQFCQTKVHPTDSQWR